MGEVKTVKKTYVLLAFVIIIIAASIYPVIYHYKDKSIKPIPKHTTLEEAVSKKLPDSIRVKASKLKCRGFIAPVEKVKGNTAEFSGLKEDINLALFSYKGWKVKVSKNEQTALQKRLDRNINRWSAIISPNEIRKILNEQKRTVLKTNYVAYAKLIKNNRNSFNNMTLIVSVNELVKQKIVFAVQLSFVSPQKIEAGVENFNKRKEELSEAKKLNDFSLLVFKGLVSIFIFYLLWVAIKLFLSKRKKEEYEKFLRKEISKRQQLIDEGHFVAALELSEKYLKVFPDDTEIVAFKERILDFTNNDPHKAQAAFVEALKLRARLGLSKDDPKQALLSSAEKEEIKMLLPYNQELKKSYLALISAEESVISHEKALKQIETIKNRIQSGDLTEAEIQINSLEKTDDNLKEIEQISELIGKKKNEVLKQWNEFVDSISNNADIPVEKTINEILDRWKTMPEAISFKKNWENCDADCNYRLIPKDDDDAKEILLLCGSNFIIGRKDDDFLPDVVLDDKRISRKHAKVYFNNGKVIIEDLNSHVGTFINGDKISNAELKHNSLVTFSKILDFNVRLYEKNEASAGVSAVQLEGLSFDIIFVNDSALFGISAYKFTLGNGNYLLKVIDGKFVIIENKKLTVINSDMEINLNGYKYLIEALS